VGAPPSTAFDDRSDVWEAGARASLVRIVPFEA